MIIIHAELQVNIAKEEAFLHEVQDLIAASQQEEGNVSYSLKRDVENPSHFTMVEVWKDIEAVQFHNSTDHFKAFNGKATQYLAAPPAIKLYDGQELQLNA
ncbi:putative quinol monooxygenase [Fictibacillus iocasae]|uniref:Quinol monooxygenase n=1 Tax=Fictibacillus iocasae TaxID=2715437 RepID=A0ABW2NNI4_9BACL